jgi:hypothetical protein
MVDIWKMQEEETYLDVNGSGDSTLGEESVKSYLQEKTSEILLFRFL